jgi:hypothetical protein
MGKHFSLTMFFVGSLSYPPQATRWDNYLHIFDPRIHWFSLINSLVIVVFLCAMVSMIIYRSVSRDVCASITYISARLNVTVSQISRYNAIDISVRTSLDAISLLIVLTEPHRKMSKKIGAGNLSMVKYSERRTIP